VCAGAGGKLADGLGGASDNAGDLRERHAEQVMEDPGGPLGRGQRLKDDQQREAHRVVKGSAVSRVLISWRVLDDGFRQPGPDVDLPACPRRPERVQRTSRHGDGGPRVDVLDRITCIGRRQPQPAFRDHVLGFAAAAEDGVSDPDQPWSHPVVSCRELGVGPAAAPATPPSCAAPLLLATLPSGGPASRAAVTLNPTGTERPDLRPLTSDRHRADARAYRRIFRANPSDANVAVVRVGS
jgi:hypothetical protein